MLGLGNESREHRSRYPLPCWRGRPLNARGPAFLSVLAGQETNATAFARIVHRPEPDAGVGPPAPEAPIVVPARPPPLPEPKEARSALRPRHGLPHPRRGACTRRERPDSPPSPTGHACRHPPASLLPQPSALRQSPRGRHPHAPNAGPAQRWPPPGRQQAARPAQASGPLHERWPIRAPQPPACGAGSAPNASTNG